MRAPCWSRSSIASSANCTTVRHGNDCLPARYAAPSAALARALLPALSTATLYAHHETWNEAARAACRTATLLTPEELSRLRDAIRRSPDARRTPAAQPYAEALEQRAATILAAVQEAAPEPGTSPAAARNPEDTPAGRAASAARRAVHAHPRRMEQGRDGSGLLRRPGTQNRGTAPGAGPHPANWRRRLMPKSHHTVG